jgi:hypothetical protein
MIFWFLGYLLAHLLVYVLLVRRLALFRREPAILLYHAAPAAAVAALAVGALVAAPGTDSLSRAALLLSLQGIYSLSFLELWSLAKGGYSLHILTHFVAAGGTATPTDLAPVCDLGAGKRAQRIASLLRLRLIERNGGIFRLTRRGRNAAAVLGCIARLVNLRQLG